RTQKVKNSSPAPQRRRLRRRRRERGGLAEKNRETLPILSLRFLHALCASAVNSLRFLRALCASAVNSLRFLRALCAFAVNARLVSGGFLAVSAFLIGIFCLAPLAERVAIAVPEVSANWPQWRGPDGQGVSTEKGLPTEWSGAKNVKWKTPIEGRGHSS